MSEMFSLIIPCKNEVESLGAVLEEIKDNKFVDEIIVVVDNDNDNSIPIIKDYNGKLIIQKKKGYGAAITEGFKVAKNKFGCIYNADYSFDPKYFAELSKLTEEYDFIFGSRYKGTGGSDDDTIITFIGNKIFTFITKHILRIKLSDILFTYVVCNVEKFNILNLKNNDFKFCIELPTKIKKQNFSYTDLEMFERKRFDGKKKVNVIKDGFLISLEIIKSFILIYFK
tara:strand:- start:3299 stop:3979 length:681 start_codon:yes stop_codon:yes gene_type:complete